MAAYAVVQGTDVINMVEWDGVTPYATSGQLVLADASAHIGGTYIDGVFSSIPGPTPENLIDMCKLTASQLLYETDWTTISDVADPAKSKPYLTNQAEFAAYRSTIRNYAVNPVVNPVWPTKPTSQWSS
jgi:hypothetical protein